jgi:hypothetical protein
MNKIALLAGLSGGQGNSANRGTKVDFIHFKNPILRFHAYFRDMNPFMDFAINSTTYQ